MKQSFEFDPKGYEIKHIEQKFNFDEKIKYFEDEK